MDSKLKELLNLAIAESNTVENTIYKQGNILAVIRVNLKKLAEDDIPIETKARLLTLKDYDMSQDIHDLYEHHLKVLRSDNEG